MVDFLATDLSDYVTGAVIPIDGGLRARIATSYLGHINPQAGRRCCARVDRIIEHGPNSVLDAESQTE
jgi:hypothetical protein